MKPQGYSLPVPGAPAPHRRPPSLGSASATGKCAYKHNPAWMQAVKAAHKEFKVTGYAAVGGKTQKGKAIYVKAKAILALTVISTLMPDAFVCNCRCAPCYAFILRAKRVRELRHRV